MTSGSTVKALILPLRRGALRHGFRQPHLAFEHVLDHVADSCCTAAFVVVAVVFPGDRDGVERAAIGRGVDLRVDDVGAGRGACAGDDRQQARDGRRRGSSAR
jgi:hypothetical protein